MAVKKPAKKKTAAKKLKGVRRERAGSRLEKCSSEIAQSGSDGEDFGLIGN